MLNFVTGPDFGPSGLRLFEALAFSALGLEASRLKSAFKVPQTPAVGSEVQGPEC